MAIASDTPSYLIVGAGNFGAATALALMKRRHCQVTLVDVCAFPSPRAASHDVNKIVHDDYPDILYMRMLVKAMAEWRNNKLYSPFYHQTGMLRADTSDFAERSMAAYRELGVPNDSILLPVDEVRKRWRGALGSANLDRVEKILYNPMVGFARAREALEAVLRAAVARGVEYHIGVVKALNVSPHGTCTSITLESGEVMQADRILLAAGARTATLLAQSAPTNALVHAGERLSARGALSFYATLTGSLKHKFQGIPVLKNCLPQVKGEGMSMLGDGTLKCNCDMSFTNYAVFPPTERARKTLNEFYGDEVREVGIESYRICWDATTPTHDFLITRHPHCRGLFVASGGSFHGWKFLPVIGEYIVDMMNGTLEAAYAARWAWEKSSNSNGTLSANPTYGVTGDLHDYISEDVSCTLDAKLARSTN